MAEPRRNLDSIPYDVFFQIASGLDCHDFIHLSRVNRTLSGMMRDESLARKTIEEHLLYTKEGQQAHQTRKGYRQAVGHLFDIKEATATAQPYAVAHVAYGSTFLYNDGLLCYVHGADIRVLDVHESSSTEQVLNLPQMLGRIFARVPVQPDCIYSLALMHFNDGVLAFLIRLTDRAEDWLFAVDVAPRPARPSTGRLRFHARLESSSRLFVRHNQSFLYYGTHSALGYHGHRKWEICCIDLNTRQQRTAQPWNLENFAGHELGQTVCFEMHRDCLYAVSTLVTFEEAEVDWTSYYMWACLTPTTETTYPIKLRRIWRRQHREGPINDTWTDLSLRKDEATDRLVILECRREWLKGGSENCRIYYKQPLPHPEEVSGPESHAAGALSASHRPPLPEDDPLAKTIDSSSKYNYEPPQKRVRRDYHPEYVSQAEPWQQQRRDFILAKTKYRTYNLLSSTFVDIVNDPDPTAAGPGCRDRLRLRMVSRKRKCPIDEHGEEGEPGRLFSVDPDLVDGDRKPLKYSEERFESRGVRFWPPDCTPECGGDQAYGELCALLCPSNKAGKVHAIADERSIIYMVDPSVEIPSNVPSGSKAIICITFDPRICFTGMKRLGDNRSGERRTHEDDGKRRIAYPAPAESAHGTVDRPVGIDLPCPADLDPGHQWVSINRTGAGAGTGSSGAAPSGSPPSVDDLASRGRRLLSEQPAMYRQIDRAYWLR